MTTLRIPIVTHGINLCLLTSLWMLMWGSLGVSALGQLWWLICFLYQSNLLVMKYAVAIEISVLSQERTSSAQTMGEYWIGDTNQIKIVKSLVHGHPVWFFSSAYVCLQRCYIYIYTSTWIVTCSLCVYVDKKYKVSAPDYTLAAITRLRIAAAWFLPNLDPHVPDSIRASVTNVIEL